MGVSVQVTAHTIDAFAEAAGGGNPAGLVADASGLSEEDMHRVAAAIGFSETAFALHSERASLRMKFFTPVEEVDLCGHATIGSFVAMLELGLVGLGRHTLETRAGVLDVDVSGDGTVMMSQNRPVFSETVDAAEVARSLGISNETLRSDLPCQVVSTGLRDVMVPVTSIGALMAIEPRFDLVKEVSGEHSTVGYHLFAMDGEDGYDAQCRNLAPLYGIPEEAATGTASGALACYLVEHGAIDARRAQVIAFGQGRSMGRPSRIMVSLGMRGTEIIGVRVGGSAQGLSSMTIEL